MSQAEAIKMAEDGSVDFDFGFDNFRPMGFTFDGVVIGAAIEKPKSSTFTFTDRKSGKEVTKDAKPQLIILVQPLDHTTKSGNPYPEYLPLTHNSRSKLGIFIEHLKKLGVSLGNDPSSLIGREFTFEMKEVSFGGVEPTRVMVPIGLIDDLNRSETPSQNGVVKGNPFASLDLETIVSALDGTDTNDALMAVTSKVRDPRVIAGMADGSLVRYLKEGGYIEQDGERYVATVTTAR